MSLPGRLLPVVVALAGCGRGARQRGEGTVAVASTSATTTTATSSAEGTRTVASVGDPDEALLRRGTMGGLAARRGPGVRRGVFDVWIQGEGGEGKRAATAEPALLAAPTAHRAPLAFYRLAKALGMDVVPVTALRAVPLAELGAAIEGDASGVLGELRVQNDGTVDVLLSTRGAASTGSPWEAPRGTTFDPREEQETAAWERWAESLAPAAGEDGALLRDYVEMLVLDYLAANVSRNAALRAGSAICLADNASAFPPRVDRPTLDRMLRRLRGVARFPRGLRDALARFDRARQAATFNEGSFEGWLLSPRTVVELDERRAALLTLIEARVAERGAAAVLSL